MMKTKESDPKPVLIRRKFMAETGIASGALAAWSSAAGQHRGGTPVEEMGQDGGRLHRGHRLLLPVM